MFSFVFQPQSLGRQSSAFATSSHPSYLCPAWAAQSAQPGQLNIAARSENPLSSTLPNPASPTMDLLDFRRAYQCPVHKHLPKPHNGFFVGTYAQAH